MSPPFPKLLVDCATLLSRLGDADWAVFDCRFSLVDAQWGRHRYLEGHLPGAHYAHLDEDLSSAVGPDTGRHPLPDPALIAERLGRWGTDEHTQIVAYDDVGGAFAVRLWWLLRWLGHERVAVLDGGLTAWMAKGLPLSTDLPRPEARSFVPRVDHSAWVSTDGLERAVGADDLLVVDARAPERFRGEIEPIDPVAGHIPGAVNLPYTGNLGEGGRFLPPEQLRERFLDGLQGVPPARVVHSCGSGVNACHNLLAMEIAGLAGSRLYAGSWSEWIRSPNRPIERG
jgi:thiosulfate/3-mercaptopyruvate sulfurtransferase